MITLKELSEASGIQEIAPGRTIGEQVYDANINTVSQDTDLGSDTYTGSIAPYSDKVDPFFSGLMQVTQPLRNTFNKYGPQIAGGVISLATGIPGIGFLMNRLGTKPYDQNLLNMYGGFGPDGRKDKFGYNVVSLMDNYMQPGSNSYRSYALEGLRSLDPVVANNYYQDTYGLTFDQVKDSIQDKENPFGPQPTNIGTSDYYGGNDNSGGFNDSRGKGGGSFGDATNNASFSDYS